MNIKTILYISFLYFFGCAIEIKNSEIRILDTTEDTRYVSTRIYVKYTDYQKKIFANEANFKFFFLDYIPHPDQEPNINWKNQKLSILFSYNEDFVKKYTEFFEIEEIQDIYSELILRPNNFHLANDFTEENIYIFLMFDHLSKYYTFSRSLIGFPLNIELRVSIFKNSKQIAFCQQFVNKNIHSNEFLELELSDEKSLFYQLKLDSRINLHSENQISKKISLCLEKLKIENYQTKN